MSEPTWFDEDPDPTGVRALLRALPDPGPMPPQVSEVIVGALADLQRRALLAPDAGAEELSAELGMTRSSGASDLGDGRTDAGAAGPLAFVGDGRWRHDVRRRRWQVLGTAAASVAALGLAGAFLGQQGSSSSTSSLRVESAVQPAVGAGVADTAARNQTPITPSRAAGPALPGGATGQFVHIELSTRAYNRANLARQAQDVVDSPGPELAYPAVEAPAVGPIGTPVGLAECVATLGEADADAVYADLATFDGAAAVVVVTVSAGLKRAFAVERSCTKGNPGLLYGPVPMP